MRKLVTLTALLFVVLTSSLWGDFNPSSGFLLEPIQRGTEVEFNYYHEDNSPASILWDINADGIFDTTTSERTLVYDYITYDTTQVIAKAMFDSLTYDMDTVSIALFDNRLPVTYDTMWVCTLTTTKFYIYSVSDSGNAVTLRTQSPTGAPEAAFTIRNKNVTFYDSVFTPLVTPSGNSFVLTKVFDWEGEWHEGDLMMIDSMGVISNVEAISNGYKYITDNDSLMLIYNGEKSYYMDYGSMYSFRYVDIYKTNGTFLNTIEPTSTGISDDENLAHEKNLEFIAKLMRRHPILTVFTPEGDTLFVKNDVYSFSPNSTMFLGALIDVDENDNIYTLIGYSFDSLTEFDLLINCYSSAGSLQWVDTLFDIRTSNLRITDDAKYLIGCTESNLTEQHEVCLWDFQTRTLLFKKEFQDNRPNSDIYCFPSYNETSDNIILDISLNNNNYLLNKDGIQIELPYPSRNIYSRNIAYEKDENRVIIYRVEW